MASYLDYCREQSARHSALAARSSLSAVALLHRELADRYRRMADEEVRALAD